MDTSFSHFTTCSISGSSSCVLDEHPEKTQGITNLVVISLLPETEDLPGQCSALLLWLRLLTKYRQLKSLQKPKDFFSILYLGVL